MNTAAAAEIICKLVHATNPGLAEPPLALQLAAPQAGQPPSRQVPRFAQIASSPLRHCSARARRLTRQICSRSTPLSRPLHRLRFRAVAFRRPQTGETVRTARARPKKKTPDGREASPDHDPQYGRDAPHVAQDQAIWPRDFVRPRHRISRKHGQLCSQTRKLAALAEGKNLV